MPPREACTPQLNDWPQLVGRHSCQTQNGFHTYIMNSMTTPIPGTSVVSIQCQSQSGLHTSQASGPCTGAACVQMSLACVGLSTLKRGAALIVKHCMNDWQPQLTVHDFHSLMPKSTDDGLTVLGLGGLTRTCAPNARMAAACGKLCSVSG